MATSITHIYSAPLGSLQELQINAGSTYGNRVAMRVDAEKREWQQELFLAADTNSVFHVKCTLPENVQWKISKIKNVPYPVAFSNVSCECAFSVSTSSGAASTDAITELRFDARHQRLACVDTAGRVNVLRSAARNFVESEAAAAEAKAAQDNKMQDEGEEVDDSTADGRVAAPENVKRRRLDSNASSLQSLYTIETRSSDPVFVENGWAGLALHPSDEHRLAVAREIGKDVLLYNGTKLERTLQLTQAPTKVKFIEIEQSHSPLVAVTENNSLALWDMRAQGDKESSLVTRLSKSRGRLFDLDYSPSGSGTTSVAMTGEDRTVYFFDSKKWTNRHTWQSCTKYNTSYVRFSTQSASNHLCYASGFDYMEFMAGNYLKQSKRNFGGVHANSRWIGLDQDSNDLVLGVTANGTVYAIDNTTALYSPE